MTTIYFIRHAEAEGNLYRISHGHYNSLLTTRGWKQVALVQERFANVHIDAVYSSDLYRTCATATSIFQSHNLPLNRDKRLREICVGVWEGHTWGDLSRLYPEQIYNFSHNLFQWEMENGEPPQAVVKRMERAVRDLAAKHPGQTLALFSHGYAIRLLMGHLQGLSQAELNKSPTGGNTAVSCLEVEGDEIRVIFRDDVSHLEAMNKGGTRPTAVQPGAYFETVSAQDINAQFGRNISGGTCLMARLDDQSIGYIQLLEEKDEQKGWIGELGLLESYRTRGFGAQLLGQAVAHYRRLGRDTVYLQEEGIDPAFFARYGFVDQGDGVWAKEGKYEAWYL